jgi:hypothetical protein
MLHERRPHVTLRSSGRGSSGQRTDNVLPSSDPGLNKTQDSTSEHGFVKRLAYTYRALAESTYYVLELTYRLSRYHHPRSALTPHNLLLSCLPLIQHITPLPHSLLTFVRLNGTGAALALLEQAFSAPERKFPSVFDNADHKAPGVVVEMAGYRKGGC